MTAKQSALDPYFEIYPELGRADSSQNGRGRNGGAAYSEISPLIFPNKVAIQESQQEWQS